MCECCGNMGKRVEETCCHQHEAGKRLADAMSVYGNSTAYKCITIHPGFYYNCLVPEVLEESWKTYKQMYGKSAFDNDKSSRLRHTAYRNLFRFIYNFSKRNQRMVLPSCAVRKIREVFPSRENNYAGFRKRKSNNL